MSASVTGAWIVSTVANTSTAPVSRDVASATPRSQPMCALYGREGPEGLRTGTDPRCGQAPDAGRALAPMAPSPELPTVRSSRIDSFEEEPRCPPQSPPL